MLQGRVCCSTPERVFGHGGAPGLPRGEIPVHFDTGPLKRRKSLNFAPGMYSSKGRIFMPRGCSLRDLPVRRTESRLYPELRV